MKRIIALAAIVCSALTATAQNRTATVSINTGTKYQYIDGFGGTGMNGQWADIYTKEKVDKLWGKGEDQMGFNIMRIRINPNENNWGEYGNPVKWAKAHGCTVFATPWTPPLMFKTDLGSTKKQNDFGTWVYPIVKHSWGGQGSNGGCINTDSIEAYAKWLERYRKTMEDKGCPVDIISIQNECDYTPTDGGDAASYESCIYSPSDMCKMVTAARKYIDPKCLVMGPETFGWGQSNYNLKLADMPDAQKNIDIWGNHFYGSNDFTYINKVREKTGKNMWMTEFLIDIDKAGWTWAQEVEMIKSLETGMQNGMSAYIYYNMINDFFASANGGSSTQLWKRAYIFSHYAKYATGKTRCRTNVTDYYKNLIGCTAYVSQSGDTISFFVMNPSAANYTLNLSLPWEEGAAKVTQVATSEFVNCIKTDMTEDYGSIKKPALKLAPGVFYTFEFTTNKGGDEPSKEPKRMIKKADASNPLLAFNYMADPTAIEYNGRMYVYATNDQMEFNKTQGLTKNTYGNITELVMLSTEDLVNWTFHGTIDVKKACPWISTSWAPSIVSREEEDGQTHFYMYFTNTAAGIGVLTATSPTGPWTDPLGHALIDGNTAGLGTISNIIDPGALIDKNGTGWLTFGGGDVNKSGTSLMPGNARIVQLGDDMISLASEIKSIPAPFHFEANELNQMGNYYVYSYCTNWADHASDWSSYSGKGTKPAPSACCIVYMTTKDPLNGTWSYKGEIMQNPGKFGYPYGNNHTHLQKFNNKWYTLYHTQYLESESGYSGGYRNLAMNTGIVVESSANINAVTPQDGGISQISAKRLNAYNTNEAECMANGAGITAEAVNEECTNAVVTSVHAGDWVSVRGVMLNDPAKSFVSYIKGRGTMEVRTELNGEPIAVLKFDNNDINVAAVNLLNTDLGNYFSNLYFVFTEAEDVSFDSWSFSTLDAEEIIAGIEYNGSTDADIKSVQYITISGIVTSNIPEEGIFIRRTTFTDGKEENILIRK